MGGNCCEVESCCCICRLKAAPPPPPKAPAQHPGYAVKSHSGFLLHSSHCSAASGAGNSEPGKTETRYVQDNQSRQCGMGPHPAGRGGSAGGCLALPGSHLPAGMAAGLAWRLGSCHQVPAACSTCLSRPDSHVDAASGVLRDQSTLVQGPTCTPQPTADGVNLHGGLLGHGGHVARCHDGGAGLVRALRNASSARCEALYGAAAVYLPRGHRHGLRWREGAPRHVLQLVRALPRPLQNGSPLMSPNAGA